MVDKGKPNTKYIRFEVDIWYQEDDQSIHITAPGDKKFHSTINDKPGSERHHRNLFKHFKRMLEEANKWADGEEQ